MTLDLPFWLLFIQTTTSFTEQMPMDIGKKERIPTSRSGSNLN